MPSTGIEPPTLQSLTRRSNQLSYAVASISVDLPRDLLKLPIKLTKQYIKKTAKFWCKYLGLGIEG